LAQHGNPFRASLLDADGKVSGTYGVSSLPATFVIDQRGVVRLRLSAPLTPGLLRDRVLPLIDGLKRRG
jgi:cytochrome c biogenesis protein CcmG/thiol:disulfide interchange protein DsbE